MAESPSQLTQPSKRPLEDPSSPMRGGGQPEAKRPALDKIVKKDDEFEVAHMPSKTEEKTTDEDTKDVNADSARSSDSAAAAENTNGQDKDDAASVQTAESEVKILTKADSTTKKAPTSVAIHDEANWIHIRAVISSAEAATIIGKAGENVANIRTQSGAKCTVNDYKKGAVERILTVSGIVDAVAKVS